MGPSLLLTKSLPLEQGPEQPGREAAWIVGQALRFIEPLAVDFLVASRPVDEPLLDESVPVAQATWHVRRDDLPAERGVRPAFQHPGHHQERRVAEVTQESLGRVLAEAVAQPAPPERRITLAHLEVKNFRIRVLDPELASASILKVLRGRFEHEVPIVRDPRGAWIDGFPEALDRPLQLDVDNNDGVMRVKLFLGWSLWAEEGTPEHAAVLDLGRAVIARGYEVEDADPEFRAHLSSPT